MNNTSIICDIAINNPDIPLSTFVDALIPYSKPNTDGIDFFEVFEPNKTDADDSIRDEHIDYADRLDKGVAAASGLLSGIIDVLFVGEFSLERAKQYGEKDVENIVKNQRRSLAIKEMTSKMQ